MDQPGRSRNATSNSSASGSAVAIVIAIASVLIGFFILNSIRGGDDDAPSGGGNTDTTDAPTTDSVITTNAPTPSSSTTTPLVVTGTSVQVVNFSGANGAAGKLADLLTAEGFTTSAGNKGAAQDKIETTEVIYDESVPEAKAVADSVARLLGGVVVKAQGLPLPNETGNWPADTAVMVKLGNDLAGDDTLPGGAPADPSDEVPTDPTDPSVPANT